jgi:hypothetical protein
MLLLMLVPRFAPCLGALILVLVGDNLLRLEPIRICTSKSVTVNDAKFVAMAEVNWKAEKCEPTPIEIHLQITNLKKQDLVFPTFDTFGLKMTRMNGTEIKPTGGRDHTILTRPVLIGAGTSYSLCRRAELHWDVQTSSTELLYYDGTGMVISYGPLGAGQYKLSFWYSTTKVNSDIHRQARMPVDNVTVWSGDVATLEVLIEVREVESNRRRKNND